jgi:hypothetical protein
MNFIFKSKQRTPSELVRNLKDAITRLEGAGVSSEGKRKVGLNWEKVVRGRIYFANEALSHH